MQPINNEIKKPIQCKHCISESDRNGYELKSMLVIGYTQTGLQVWCTKHNVTVMSVKHDELTGIINRVWEGYS